VNSSTEAYNDLAESVGVMNQQLPSLGDVIDHSFRLFVTAG